MGFSNSNITTAITILLLLVLSSYALFEFRSKTDLTLLDIERAAEESIQDAKSNFDELLFAFSSSSAEYAGFIENTIRNNQSFDRSETSTFWGSSVFKNDELIYWEGFPHKLQLDSLSKFSSVVEVSIVRDNNVLQLLSRIPFEIATTQDTSKYLVFTSKKLSQENILPIAEELDQSISSLLVTKYSFPVTISFDKPSIENTLSFDSLSTISSSNAGYLIASNSSIQEFTSANRTSSQLKQSIFHLLILILSGTLLAWVSRNLPKYLPFLIQLLILGSSFFSIQYIFDKNTNEGIHFFSDTLLLFSVYTTLCCLVLASINNYLNRFDSIKTPTSSKTGIVLSGVIGILQAISFYFFFVLLEDTLDDNISLFFNELFFSNWSSNLLIILTGMFFYLLLGLNYYIIKKFIVHAYQIKWISLLSSSLMYVLTVLTIILVGSTSETTLGHLLFMALPYLIAVSWLIVQSVAQTRLVGISVLRSFLVLNAAFSILFFSTIRIDFTHYQLDRLTSAIEQSQSEEVEQVTTITQNLLLTASRTFSESNSFSFEDIIRNTIKDEWTVYSISVQLIDSTGLLLSDYTTNLSAPQWSTEYRIDELAIPFEFEQGRARNVRPIIREQPINIINGEFSTFRRGWIPIFDDIDSEMITHWILASVYNELSNPNRPFRSVISSSQQSSSDIAVSVTEYQNLIPIRNSTLGIPRVLPGYSQLPNSLLDALPLQQPSPQYIEIQGEHILELFLRLDEESIVRAASITPKFSDELFLFLRIYLTLIFPILVLSFFISVTNKWGILRSSRSLKDKLIDRSIVSSIVCLLVMVGITYIVLDQQNSSNVQDELLARLNSLVENIQSRDSVDVFDPNFLQASATILEEDLAIFSTAELINSTTPQIYTQHILPDVVPFMVHHNLLEKGFEQEVEIIELDNRQMMVGYQPWFDDENNVVGIAAIPTFLRTPKFYDELLSTTSYLLAFYSFIFGLLMISIGFIASKMTSPIEQLKQGLSKISKGDLNTELKVTSDDELGTLTKAFNTMAQRLKHLQEELATSEREAAWKEMAQQVAHEIKNPLTPMKLNLQHLERQLSSTEHKLREKTPNISSITQSMIEQIEALNKIASDFSKFARPLQQEFEKIELNDLVKSVTALYDQEFVIDIKLAPRKLVILGIQNELRRVLVNLIKNAQESINDGGNIRLTTETDSKQKHALIHISDDGKGIPDIDQPKIFTPSFSTKTSGTGLGLAITKKIIEEHSGSISFTSEERKGTTFTIKLPLKLK